MTYGVSNGLVNDAVTWPERSSRDLNPMLRKQLEMLF